MSTHHPTSNSDNTTRTENNPSVIGEQRERPVGYRIFAGISRFFVLIMALVVAIITAPIALSEIIRTKFHRKKVIKHFQGQTYLVFPKTREMNDFVINQIQDKLGPSVEISFIADINTTSDPTQKKLLRLLYNYYQFRDLPTLVSINQGIRSHPIQITRESSTEELDQQIGLAQQFISEDLSINYDKNHIRPVG